MIIRFIGTSVVYSFTEKWHPAGIGRQKCILFVAGLIEKLEPHGYKKGMIFR